MRRSCLTLLMAATFASGCLQPQSSTPAYRYQSVKGPSADEEVKFYTERLKSRPNSFLERNSLAQAYLAKAQGGGDANYFLLAEKLANESLKIQENEGAQLILASVDEARHDFDGARRRALAVFQANPGSLEAQTLMGNALLEMGELDKAWTYISAAAQSTPTAAAMMQVARAQTLRGHDDEARKTLEQAIQAEQAGERKVSARLRSLLGEWELRHGHLDKAEALFEQSRQIQKNNVPALQGMAQIMLRRGKPEEALPYYAEGYSFGANPALLVETARVKQRLGRQEEVASLRQNAASSLEPDVQKGKFGHARDLARLRMDEGKPDDALRLLESEEKQRRDWKLYDYKARALEQLKRPQEALQAVERAGAIQEPLLYGRAARLCKQMGDAARAAEWEKKCRAVDPTFRDEWLDL